MRVCVCVFSVYLRINYLPFGRTNTKLRCSQTWDGPRPLATRGPRDCDKSKSFKIIVYVLQLKYKPRLPNQSVYESSRVVGNFEDLDGLVGRAGGKSSSVVVQLGIMLQRTTAPPPPPVTWLRLRPHSLVTTHDHVLVLGVYGILQLHLPRHGELQIELKAFHPMVRKAKYSRHSA